MELKVVVDLWEEGEFIDTVQHLTGGRVHMVKLAAPDGTVIELLKDEHHVREAPEERQLCDQGISHVAFTVDNVEDIWRRLRGRGCQTLSEPVLSPDAKARFFFARDPEGNLLEIVQPTDGGPD